MAIVTPIRRNLPVRHPNRRPQTRSEAYAALAAHFERRCTPEDVRASELYFSAQLGLSPSAQLGLSPSAPVAAAMRELAAAR
jgi:hypothetical protein